MMRNNIMAAVLPLLFCITVLTSCHQETMAERAQREAKEYTEKMCPTPPQNGVITDSLVFDMKTNTEKYYVTFTGDLDNAEVINKVSAELRKGMLDIVRNNPSMKAYKDAGFRFSYICRSEKDRNKILIEMNFGPKDYN